MLLPMIGQAQALADEHTVMTADAGYHSHENMQALHEAGIAAMVADGQMRKRDERLAGQQRHRDQARSAARQDEGPGASRCGCSARATSSWTRRPTAASARRARGCTAAAAAATSTGASRTSTRAHRAAAARARCASSACAIRNARRCGRWRCSPAALAAATSATELMKRAIDSARGRAHLQPAHRHGGAGVRQHPPHQAAGPLHACGARRRWARSGGCIAWCTTSRSWRATDQRETGAESRPCEPPGLAREPQDAKMRPEIRKELVNRR